MRKAILLAGLLLIGVACSKNDNNEPSKQDDGKDKVQKPGDKIKMNQLLLQVRHPLQVQVLLQAPHQLPLQLLGR